MLHTLASSSKTDVGGTLGFQQPIAIRVVSTFTVEPLEEPLNFLANLLGVPISLTLAPYGSLFQELLAPESSATQGKSITVLLVRPEDWLHYRNSTEATASVESSIEADTQLLLRSITSAADRHAAQFWIALPPAQETIPACEAARAEIQERLVTLDGVKLAPTLASIPASSLFDTESDRLGHIPFHPIGYAALAMDIMRYLAATVRPPFKVLVLDADETLWEGVCAEGDVHIKPRHRRLQAFALEQKKQGVLLAIASKNEESDVRRVFASHPDMLLKEDDILTWRVNWRDKAHNLHSIAEELVLALDSFVFIDDNAIEIEAVRITYPEVLALHWPSTHEKSEAFIDHLWAFDRVIASSDRTDQYRQQIARQNAARSAPTYADFIAKLNVQITSIPVDETYYERIAELTQRTNQFNTTGRRLTTDQVREELNVRSGSATLLKVSDRFGDYGIVGLSITSPNCQNLIASNFLLSCRVLGKGVEYALLAEMGKQAIASGFDHVLIPFQRTERNTPAAIFLDRIAREFQCTDGSYLIPAAHAAAAHFEPEQKQIQSVASPRNAAGVHAPHPSGLAIIAEWLNSPAALLDALNSARSNARRSSSKYVAPASETEHTLAEIWENVLLVHPIGVIDSFMELGGTSILATRIASRIRATLGVSAPLSIVYQNPTIRALASYLDSHRPESSLPQLVKLTEGSKRPISPAQKRLWFLQNFAPEQVSYNIPLGYELPAETDLSLLEQALQKLEQRHQILRTTYPTTLGAPALQVVEPSVTLARAEAKDRQDALRMAVEEAARPFDLEQGPIWRALVVRTPDASQLLIITIHHIAADGWSLAVLQKELTSNYQALSDESDPSLPLLPVQYQDYAAWQRAQQGQPSALDSDVLYWKQVLTGAPAFLPLPTDRRRPAAPTGNGGMVRATVAAPLVRQLTRHAQDRGATLFTLLLAAYKVLLHRHANANDLIVGVPVSGRNHYDIEGLIGCFVNTLPIRSKMDGDQTFLHFTTAVRDAVHDALAHGGLPFDTIVEQLKVARDASRTPLFQVVFVFQDSTPPPLTFSGHPAPGLEFHNGSAKFDQSLEATPQADGGLRLSLEFNSDIFVSASAESFLSQFLTLLGSIAAQPQLPIDRLNLLSDQERHNYTNLARAERPFFPSTDTIASRFERQALQRPQTTAVTCEGQSLTYEALNHKANQLAHYLRSQGIQPDTLVGVCMERSLDLIVALLGILKAGAAYLPIDLAYPADRLSFMLQDAHAPILLTQSHLAASLPQHAAQAVCLDDTSLPLWEGPTANLVQPPDPRRLAYVIYTSGSTGKPKGVPVPHRNVIRLLDATDPWFHFNSEDVWTMFHSYAFDFSVWEIWGSLLYGGRLVIVPYHCSRSPEEFHKLLAEERVTVLNQTPSAFKQLIAAEEFARTPAPLSLRFVIFGGEALEMASLKPWFDRHGDQAPQLVNMYGITETTVHVTYRPLTRADLDNSSVIGIPIPDLELYLLDRYLQPVPCGIAGEIFVGGPGLARGYLNRPELTAERFITHPFNDEEGARLYRSGDLGRRLANGDIEYLGRMDQQVQLHGFRIELGEVECVLATNPAIAQTKVILREDTPGDQRLCAYYVAAAGLTPSVADLRAHCRPKLPDYMIPSAFVGLNKFPLTQNGKLDVAALPTPSRQRGSEISDDAQPHTITEHKLASIWCEVLGLDEVGTDRNFFELGGDSILSIQIIAKARAAGLNLLPRHLFKNQTIATLAAAADAAQTPIEPAAPSVPHNDVPLTPIQRWFFEHQFAEANHWTQAFLFENNQPLDASRLRKALQTVVERHPALRLRFVNHRQQVADVESSELLQEVRGDVIDTLTAQQALNIEQGPLIKAVLFSDARRLFITIHHLAVDGVSWRILLEDLEQAYLGKPLPPSSVSFPTWAAQLATAAGAPAFEAEAAYWNALHWHAPQKPALPPDASELGANDESTAETVTVSLTANETTSILKEAPAHFGVKVNATLLTALCVALRKITGQGSYLLDLEGHGREHAIADLDITRTVGWFTSIYPAALRLPASEEWPELLSNTQQQLDAIPHQGVGYGLLKYLGSQPLRPSPEPTLLFNYLGQFDQVTSGLELLRFAPESTSPWHDGQNQRTHALELNTLVLDGQLQIRATFSTALHQRATVEKLARQFARELGELAALLQSRKHKSVPAAPEATLLPLSPMQRLFYVLGTSRPHYAFDQWQAHLLGPLDVDLFQQAWDAILARHSILRTSFSAAGQQVHSTCKAPWDIRSGGDTDIPKLLEEDRLVKRDLAEAPLSRFYLLELSATEHFFLWSVPDLQMDGWSWPVVFAELSHIYDALIKAQAPNLPEARPYGTYLNWLAAQDPQPSLQFWRQNLADWNRPTPLPLDLPPSRKPRRIASAKVTVSTAVTIALRDNAQKHRRTLNLTVQGAWAALLAHCAKSSDVVFGASFSGRPAELPGVEGIVGPFTNHLPVRANVASNATVTEFLSKLQETLFEIDEHQFVSPLDLQDVTNVPWKDRIYNSLVVFQNYRVSGEASRLGNDVVIQDFEGPLHTNFDLTLVATPGPSLELELFYNTTLFSPERADLLLANLNALLESSNQNLEAEVSAWQSHLTLPQNQDVTETLLPVDYVAPSTALESKICAVWSKAFGLTQVSTKTNFFDLGGNSLLLLRVHTKLQETLGRTFPIVTLFQYPTIASFARHWETPTDPIAPQSTPAASATDGVAMVGMAIRVPGADSIEQFWNNLIGGVETINTIAPQDLAPGEPSADPDYVPRRGLLNNAFDFDASFFGFSPKEAEVTDPQQRLFLELAHQALEAAGVDPEQWRGAIGVYAGMGQNYYYLHHVHSNTALRDMVGPELVMLGNEKDYLASRVSYKLNLTGPAISVHAACSTSLVAVCQAARALLDGECDMALAGGVAVRFPQERGYRYEEGGIHSNDGHCRAFDTAAAGTVFSNGLGVVALKRLADAQKDGDRIYAVIKGVGLNNDGANKVSFTAPSVDGQAGAITRAISMAGFDPDTISYVEAHGTGTPLGDPIEVAGLTQAFRSLGARGKQFCGLGSLKPSTGHLDAAAGVCGLIKAALAVYHRQIPPSLHFQKASPKLLLEESPFYVVDRPTEWRPLNGAPIRAGVSSLGVGGTNAHVILEEPPVCSSSVSSRTHQLLVLSAKTETALEKAKLQLADHLASNADVSLADVAFTLQVGRRPYECRTAVVGSSHAEIIERLKSPSAIRRTTARGREVAFLFPGQGAQYPGMGAGLYQSEPVFRKAVDRCCEILRPVLGLSFQSILFPQDAGVESRELLKQTRFTQPAIFVISYALAELWRSWSITPSSMLGHSVGEYVAATLAGVFSLEDGLTLVAHRADLVQSLPGGAMLAVRAPAEKLLPLLGGVDLAAKNSPNLTVVAGDFAAIEQLEHTLKAEGIAAKRLATSHAFHSKMMEPALPPFTECVRRIRLHEPQIPIVSTLTGQWMTAKESQSPAYWAAHMRNAVLFEDGLATLFARHSGAILEAGPGATGVTFARQNPHYDKDRLIVSSLPTPNGNEQAAVLDGLGRLWTDGVSIEWSSIHGSIGDKPLRTPLPTYPFERVRYVASASQAPLPSAAAEIAPALQANQSVSVQMDTPLPPPTQTRLEYLVQELKAQIHEISGMDLNALVPHSTFLELGFDSLFLTQATLVLKKRFETKITFRQLMEELNSIEKLAAYLDIHLAPGRFAPPVTAPVPSLPIAPSSNGGSAPSTPLEARVAALENVVAKLAGSSLVTANSTAATEVRPSSGIRVRQQNPNPEKKVAFGPFRPIQHGQQGTLTALQQAHVRELIAQYNQRTGASKHHTQKYREVLADPRAAAGFNLLWKDLVYPLVVDRSHGSKIWDIDGNEYVDVTLGFGLSLFGHRPDFVQDALKAQLDRGIEIGPSHPLAGEVAAMVREISGQDRVSFCNTGSEAVTAAIRIARTVTGREKIAMFTGSYHGIFDEVLVRPLVVNGELRSMPIAPGITQSAVQEIIVLEYGNPESLEILRRHGSEIAALLVETVQSRRPELQPIEFIKELRAITKETETALIFDEVVTGFRVGLGGNQERFGIKADIVTYGKVIGGGLPIGVVAGAKRFMDALDGGTWQYGDASIPEAGVTFFAGTFVRHPLALAAAKAVLTHLRSEGPSLQRNLEERTEKLVASLNEVAEKSGVPLKVTRFSSLYFFHFAPELKHASLFFVHMRLRGIHIWESRGSFISTAHSDEDLQKIVSACAASLEALQHGGFFPRPGTVDAQSESAAGNTYRLTASQEELFLNAQLDKGADLACNETVLIRFHKEVSVPTLQQALQKLVDRHECLRTHFLSDGSGQIVATTRPIPLPLHETSSIDEWVTKEADTTFDLIHGPLMRACLLHHNGEHVLLLTAHHSICDGWSFDLLISDLAAFYNGESLAPAEPFHSYAQEQANFRQSKSFAENETYWRGQFATLPQPLELPLDFKRHAVRSYRSDTVFRTFSPELSQKIRGFCKSHGLTPYTLLLGTYHILLSRLSGQDDVVIGAPIAGQPASEMSKTCGHCVNFLPMRLAMERQLPAIEHLKKVQAAVFDTMEHQEYTLGYLTRTLQYARSQSRPQFVQVTFTLEPEAPSRSFGDARASISIGRKTHFAFDHGLFVTDTSVGFELRAVYSSDYFKGETAVRWMEHYITLLEDILQTPTTAVARLNLMNEAAKIAQLKLVTGAVEAFSCAETIADRFERQAAQFPHRVATNCGDTSITYQELNQRANQLAHHLIHLGVKPDHLIGICSERSLDLLVGLLGILKAGAAYLPIDLAYPADRLAFMLEDAKASFLLTQKHLQERLPSHHATILCLDDPDLPAWNGPTSNPSRSSTPDSLAYVIYTSGSTGKPKGVLIPNRNVIRLFDATECWFHFSESDVWTMFHSYAFDFSVWEIWGALLYGGRVVIVSYDCSRSPHEFYQLLANEKVTVLNQTPSAFEQLSIAEESAPSPLPLSLRLVIFGGEALEMQSLRPWFERHGDQSPQLVNMYGITETTVHVTYRPLSKDDLTRGSLIGRPIPDLTLYLLDSELQPTPQGVAGEIYVGGGGVSKGYLNRPELTAERFIRDPFSSDPGARLYRSGDLARYVEGGDIEYLGRIDHQVQLRGFRVELGEIESVLATHPAITQVKVVLREDTPGDQRLCAYFKTVNGSCPSTSELRSLLGKKLPDYMIPASFMPLPQFPLTENGKLDTKALPAPTSERPSSSDAYEPLQTATEKELAAIWAKILRVDRVARHDDFFELGGHSLLGLSVFTNIQREFGVTLPLATLFRAPTLSELAALIDSVRPATTPMASDESSPYQQPVLLDLPLTPSCLALIQGEGKKVPMFAIHGGDGGILFYGDLARQLPHRRRFYALEAPTLLDRTKLLQPFTIEDTARAYIEEIRKAQPNGPYLLSGYSVGGVIAWEMAQQLLSAGESVLGVVLFDTSNPHVEQQNLYSFSGRIAARWRMHKGQSAFSKLIGLGARFANGIAHKRKHLATVKEAAQRLHEGAAVPDEIRIIQVREAHTDAYERYCPAPLNAPVILLRANLENDRCHYTEHLGWEGLTPAGITVLPITGEHLEIFKEPHLRVLVSQLEKALTSLP